MRKDKKTQLEIARAIGVSQAAVSKELKRNRCFNGRYSPSMAQMFAEDAKQRSRKPRKMDALMQAFIRGSMAREEFGHFEMDLMQNGKDFILTLTERKSRFLLMERLAECKNAGGVADTVIKLLRPFRKRLRSITTDNGGEFAGHKLIAKKLGVPVFFTASCSFNSIYCMVGFFHAMK